MNEPLLKNSEDRKEDHVRQLEVRANWGYLIPLVSTLVMGCSIVGFVIVGNNQVGGVLAEKLSWDEKASTYNTAISSVGISGLIIGSFAVDPLLKAIDRRSAIILTSFICSVAVIPTIILNLWAIILGKFFFGLAAGGLIVASSIYMNETIPAEHSSTFGFAINFGVISGIMLCLLVGAGLPDPQEDPQAAKDDSLYIVINLIPTLIGCLNILLWLCFFKLESLKSCMPADRESTPSNDLKLTMAKANVAKIYRCENDEQRDAIFAELWDAHLEAAGNQTKPPGYGQVLCDPAYSKATWLVVAIALFNQLSGVNLISIYSTQLFTDLSEQTSEESFTISPGTGSALVGVFQFVGCLVAPLLGKVMGLRTIFIVGQFAMALSQLAVAICVGANGALSTTIFILVFLTCYQATQGSFFWFYAAAVASDTGNSVAGMTLWAGVLLMSTCSNALLEGLGQQATFYTFSAICFAGGLVFLCVMKEVTGLTKEQQQSLYSPDTEMRAIPQVTEADEPQATTLQTEQAIMTSRSQVDENKS